VGRHLCKFNGGGVMRKALGMHSFTHTGDTQHAKASAAARLRTYGVLPSALFSGSGLGVGVESYPDR